MRYHVRQMPFILSLDIHDCFMKFHSEIALRKNIKI